MNVTKYILIVFLCFITLTFCQYNCSLKLTPRVRCNCMYRYIQICTGNNSTQCILSCINRYQYDIKCLNGQITGDISINDTLNCPYETSIECSFVGILGFPCLFPGRRFCPIDSTLVACVVNVRLLCEQTGGRIMESGDFFETVNSTHYCENCTQSNITTRITRCPTQPNNMNRGLQNCIGNVECTHHHEWEEKCRQGCTANIESFQINENCTNSSLLIQGLCPNNFSFVCNVSNNISICINNDDTFNLCSESIISFSPCEPFIFPSTTSNPPVSPIPIPTPLIPIPGLAPTVPTPLNGVNCSEIIFIQGNCTDGFNASCCFENFTFECITTERLIEGCLLFGCRPLLENEICEKIVIPPITPTTPIKKDDPLSTLAIIFIVIGSILLLIIICLIGTRINNRRNGFDTIS